MVLCPTITVTNPVPTVTVVDKGFAADGTGILNCNSANIVGKAIQFMVYFQSTSAAMINSVLIKRQDPDGQNIPSLFTNVSVPAGSSQKLFIAAPVGSVYVAGTYTITSIEILGVNPV